ncbi:hypothetical protein FRC08_001135 [Ceratobasidium sp. 394]|nr:hypothetical protein FRC08_001135 [Ceratobasidium sp. 394]
MSSSLGGDSPATPSPAPALSVLTRIAFYLFGVVALVPWNALILDLPYLLNRLDGSPFQGNLGSWITISYTASGFIALAVATWLADKLRPTATITLSICLLSITLLVLATLPLWPVSSAALFASTVTGSVILACSASFFRTPVVAVATAFGPEAVASYFSGTALVAVVISAGVFAAAYLSNTAGIHDGKPGTILAFTLSAFVSLSSLAAYHFGVRHTEVFRAKFKSRAEYAHPERDWLLQAQLRMVLAQGEGVWATTKRNWGYNLAQCWIFVVTLAVFPAITTLVVPITTSWTPLVFHTFHFLVYNLGDLAGRLLVSIHTTPIPPLFLFAYCTLQTLLVPLFLLCNTTPHLSGHVLLPTTRLASPPLIGDIGFLALVFLFGLNSGYVSSLGFVSVGRKKGARARSGARVLQLWMFVGFVLGSAASFGVGRLM